MDCIPDILRYKGSKFASIYEFHLTSRTHMGRKIKTTIPQSNQLQLLPNYRNFDRKMKISNRSKLITTTRGTEFKIVFAY